MPEKPEDHAPGESRASPGGSGEGPPFSREGGAEGLDVFAGGGTVELPPDQPGTQLYEQPGGVPPVSSEPPVLANPSPDVEGMPAELIDHPRYRVLRLLGRGGMGAVFQAEHRVMQRPVALKVIHREMTAGTGAERFLREVRGAARLHHPNIVASYDAEHADDLHFLVMEYVEGHSLADEVQRRGPLPVREACDHARQACAGLQYAHSLGFVHRDIKPDNLMLTPGGQVKILDFGIARFALRQAEEARQLEQHPEKPSDRLTLAGSIMGTPDYMAPEQGTDSSQADARADIYSLGCTLYYLLTGQPPFPDGTISEKIARHRNEIPAPVHQSRMEVPAELSAVVAKMMAKAPADRYQTPEEAADALAPFVAGPARAGARLWAWLAGAAGGVAALWLVWQSMIQTTVVSFMPLAGLALLVLVGVGAVWWMRRR